jgi:hypothetical protein
MTSADFSNVPIRGFKDLLKPVPMKNGIRTPSLPAGGRQISLNPCRFYIYALSVFVGRWDDASTAVSRTVLAYLSINTWHAVSACLT